MVDYVLDRQTLKREVVPIPEDRLELEIGDSKQEEAVPQAKIMRWDNEVNLSVRRDNGSRTFRREKDKIRFEASKEDVVIYELEEGLEVELHFKEKPDSNVFDFSIETKGLNFYYQPELTLEEIERGAVRPDNVVGSYAVYHATNRDNRVNGKHYKTGKFCHIYRPHVVDAGGVETWADLFVDVDAKILRVTVPQDYLDRALYPVIVDPTFGYESVGSTREYPGPIRMFGSEFSSGSSGTITKITAYVYSDGDFFGDSYMKAVILSSGERIITNGVSDGIINATAQWCDFTFSTDPTISNTDYILTTMNDGGGLGQGFWYDTGSTGQGFESEDTNDFLSPTDPADDTTSPTRDDKKFSIYATYEEVSTPGISKITSIIPDLENGYVYSIIPESSYTPIHLNIVSNDVSYSTEDANENIQYWNGSSWATYPSAGLSSSAGEQFRLNVGSSKVGYFSVYAYSK